MPCDLASRPLTARFDLRPFETCYSVRYRERPKAITAATLHVVLVSPTQALTIGAASRTFSIMLWHVTDHFALPRACGSWLVERRKRVAAAPVQKALAFRLHPDRRSCVIFFWERV